MMHLIPVIDLKNGIAVHAKLGLRNQYLPLHTPLCPNADVEKVMTAFLTLYPFKIIYLADLNAITHSGNHDVLINRLLRLYPDVTFWVDSGYQAKPAKFVGLSNYQAVLGSECYNDNELVALSLFENNFILSLDFSTQQALGSPRLFYEIDLWPEKIIIMTLARVGSCAGVDLEKLQFFQDLVPHKTLVAAGGIRHQADLLTLKKCSINYALCASALHAGTLSTSELLEL